MATIKQKLNKLVLLVNLGSPEELSVNAIRKFLQIFLSDTRVVNLPRYLWFPILYGIILPIRSKKLLHKYQQIWLDGKGMPLSYYTQQQAAKLQQEFDSDTVVDYAFCYGSRTISERLNYFETNFLINELIVLPLYPQYSSSTTAPVFDQLSAYYRGRYQIPSIKFINSFASNQLYIQQLADDVRKLWVRNNDSTKLVVSFHSVPVKMIESGDRYVQECETTYRALCAELGIDSERDARLCYQSKFGKAKWVEPATDVTIKSLALDGCEHIVVICPGFVSDCLETLEEVSSEYRDLFLNNGGKQFTYVPCFNDSQEFIQVLKSIVID